VSEPSARLQSLWDEPVFAVAGVEYAWIDVALWAMAHGQWPAFEEQLACGLACVTRARVEHSEPTEEQLDEAATAFRYERELLAASEITDWLERNDLSLDEWTEYLRRELLRERWHDQLEVVLSRYEPSEFDLAANALAEGVCSKTFDRFREEFSSRVALLAAHTAAAEITPPDEDAAIRISQVFSPWLSSRSQDDTRARLMRVLASERQFTALIEEALAQTGLSQIVEQHRWLWQQVELDTVQFATESAAREAILCVTVDRLTLHDVAALARRSAERRLYFADELDADFRDRVFGADHGQLLGPTAVNGHFEVSAIVRRAAPSVTDNRVAARARQCVVDTVIRRAVRDHVTIRSRI
jgi:hypothetical protein